MPPPIPRAARAPSAVLACLLAVAAAVAPRTDYAVADDYAVRFDTRAAAGTFRGLAGTVRFDPADLDGSLLDVTVDVATVSTGNSRKDGHARGAAWFDAATYPTIGFRSTAFAKTDAGYAATGQLTMRGVTREVTLPFAFEPAAAGAGGTFRGSLVVDRHDYGIEGSFGQFAVGDEVEVELVVPVR